MGDQSRMEERISLLPKGDKSGAISSASKWGAHMESVYKILATVDSVGKFDNLIGMQFIGRVQC